MAPYLNGVDHGPAAKVLEGVIFADEDGNLLGEPSLAQPLDSVDDEPLDSIVKEPVRDGAETPSALGGQKLGDEDKENVTPIEEVDRGNAQPRSLQGQLQARREEKPKKKKKKSGKSKTKGAKKRGTGFEDYYCDSPLTPAEAHEEKTSIYPPDRPFVDRIEECIQRYRVKRRLDNTKENIFNKYLNLGGIDTAPRMFQSMATINMDEANTDEIRGMTTGDVIHRGGQNPRYYDPSDPDNWEVDFAGVAAGFFSERIFKLAGTDMALIQLSVDVVTNFLNYVLHHDVCPEHTEDINHARVICASAVDQITRGFRFHRFCPGEFNRACHSLFDDGANDFFEFDSAAEKMTPDHAKRNFYASVACHDHLFDKVKNVKTEAIKVVYQVTQTFEVESIILPTEEQIQGYLGVKDENGEVGNVKPCGLVSLRAVELESGWDKAEITGPARGLEEQEIFVFDAEMLKQLTAGMKIKALVSILNIGVKFIKDVRDVRPSFYTFLPQELMLRYRAHEPNERPAPCVENPDADEGGAEGKEKDEFAG